MPHHCAYVEQTFYRKSKFHGRHKSNPERLNRGRRGVIHIAYGIVQGNDTHARATKFHGKRRTYYLCLETEVAELGTYVS